MCCRYQAKYMLAVLLLISILLLVLIWKLVNVIYTNHQHYRQLISFQKKVYFYNSQMETLMEMQEKNQDLIDLYNDFGQSIAALHIQLKVAEKLWEISPQQSQESLSEASKLSASLMSEVRERVREMEPPSLSLYASNYRISYTEKQGLKHGNL
jgi:glucose-6-phosphate-specific signal transduction histidine kinase